MLHHVVDEHVWALYGGETGGRCAHEQLDEEERKKPWLKKNSPAHDALRKIIMDKRLLNTLKYYTNFRLVYNMYVLLYPGTITQNITCYKRKPKANSDTQS